MRYGSVCSGIEAATIAWEPLGWEAAWYSEIDKFPSAVLQHHYPKTPNLGDMTKFKEWPNEPIDILVGGTPCQSFSVAGLRKGLDDPRGNLMLTYLAIAGRYRPRWTVWENVPGVLSSNGGKDFGTFLGALAEIGYGFAYRVLDAQYFGVPQRRRRVFVVGYFGDWRPAAAVLFERHSLSGDTPPRRKTGERVAETATRSFDMRGNGDGETVNCITGDHASRPTEYTPVVCAAHNQAQTGHLIAFNAGDRRQGVDSISDAIFPCMQAKSGTGGGNTPIICMETGQASAGIGIGTTLNCNHEAPIVAISQYGDIAGSLTARHDSSPCADRGQNAVAIQDGRGMDKKQNGKGYSEEDTAYTLDGVSQQAIAFSCKDHGADAGEIAPTLRAMNFDKSHANAGGQVAVAINTVRYGDHNQDTLHHESGVLSTLPGGTHGNGGHYTKTVIGPAVRRLTPRECERLQGFKDDYTLIPWRIWKECQSKGTSYESELLKRGMKLREPSTEECPDGPRYKALGNSMAVPVMRWIGERIGMVEKIIGEGI